MSESPDWRDHGVKVIPGDQLAPIVSPFSGLQPATAIDYTRAGARKLYAGVVNIGPAGKTGAHHHGEHRNHRLRGVRTFSHAVGQMMAGLLEPIAPGVTLASGSSSAAAGPLAARTGKKRGDR